MEIKFLYNFRLKDGLYNGIHRVLWRTNARNSANVV